MPNILDLIQLLIDPNKNVSVCFMCFKQGNTDEMLNVYEEDIYIEGLRSQQLSLVALMKEIFPKQDIILGQACQKCVDLVLNIYTYLRRKKRIEELLHLIVDNVNKKINNQVLTNGKIYIDSVYTERSVDESRDRKINSTDDKEAGNLVNIEIEELTCPICFKAQQDLAKHLKQHKQRIRKGYSCNTCPYTTKCKTTLEGHINSKHLNCKPYICTCSKRFYTKSALAEHSKTHTHLKDVICEICGETFHYKKSLYNHLKLHYNEKNI
ncbi:unnamed protein product [Leptosia nina]|uniref:C2H2-type domain-containing protein n=1 Tax=Leptosia nina TaxID=320188 RepID=A0AAV1JJN0_9NEOP